ncbi:PH domain-containing protein [Natronorubrum texcoconense]|uniref:PH domain-containing protein n=1 Tax=Natronorubrum texcoconense TaxID=1095776 RepID=A0A1G8X6K4_9EURY|nr:PH domain-containing protein [Natronorubrum texcoconense]SDJ86279.1 PH domain-containing protein [Natronorubrum texcoconense]
MANAPAVTDGDDHGLEWLSLDDDESVLWSGGPDRRTIAPTAALLALPVLSLLVVPFNAAAGLALTAVLALVVGPLVAWSVLWIRRTDYVVTTSALYAKRGILSRDVKRIDFEKVQNTSYSQSAIGTRVGYGTVEVSSAGGSGVEMSFRSIPEPREIQQLISSRVSPGRSSSSRTNTDSDADVESDDVLEEILAELRAIRAALEEGETNRPRPSESQPTDADAESVTLEHDSADSQR